VVGGWGRFKLKCVLGVGSIGGCRGGDEGSWFSLSLLVVIIVVVRGRFSSREPTTAAARAGSSSSSAGRGVPQGCGNGRGRHTKHRGGGGGRVAHAHALEEGSILCREPSHLIAECFDVRLPCVRTCNWRERRGGISCAR
jgi:hypothetical protein